MPEKAPCPHQAVYIYAWAGKMRVACYEHGQAMMMLGNVMGNPVACREYMTEERCSHPDDLVDPNDVKHK
jgi:hypothetical protein